MNAFTNSTPVPTVSIGGTQIHPLAYKGVRVITSELLAKEFGTNADHLAVNLSRNKSRFEEGVHFYRITGEELKALKNDITFCKVVGSNANQLMLWTERGVFRHAKILETDQAWNAYERLEDVYFAVQEARRAPTMAELVLQNAQALVDFERRQAEQDKAIQKISAEVTEMKQSLTILDRIPANGELVTHLRRRVAKEFGLSFDVINRVLDTSVYALHPKFAVRNHHVNADGGVNFGYWKREVNTVFRRFVLECEQVSPTQCIHHDIDGRFRLVKGVSA